MNRASRANPEDDGYRLLLMLLAVLAFILFSFTVMMDVSRACCRCLD